MPARFTSKPAPAFAATYRSLIAVSKSVFELELNVTTGPADTYGTSKDPGTNSIPEVDRYLNHVQIQGLCRAENIGLDILDILKYTPGRIETGPAPRS